MLISIIKAARAKSRSSSSLRYLPFSILEKIKNWTKVNFHNYSQTNLNFLHIPLAEWWSNWFRKCFNTIWHYGTNHPFKDSPQSLDQFPSHHHHPHQLLSLSYQAPLSTFLHKQKEKEAASQIKKITSLLILAHSPWSRDVYDTAGRSFAGAQPSNSASSFPVVRGAWFLWSG